MRCSREVVLCAGAIGTPHLLQLSGIGPRGPLEAAGVEVVHEHPSVGANLLDHLANGLLVRTKGVETLASAESLPNLVRWALLGRGPLTSNLGEAVAFVRSRPDLDGSRPRAPPRPGAVRGGRAQAAERARPHARRRPPRAAKLRNRPPSLGRPTRAARDRPAVPHRPGRRGRGDASPRASTRTPRARAGAARVARRRRDPPRRRRTIGRRAPRAHPRAVADALPPGRNVSHGVGRRLGRRSAASRPRDRRAAHRRCLRHPEAARAATRTGRP